MPTAAAQNAAQASAETYGPVGNETLWSIARKVGAGRSGTTAQIAWALYRTNPGAFDGSPNKVRPGATLKIPGAAVVNEIAAAEAYALLTGKAPAATPPSTPAVAVAPAGKSPTITGVELAPLMPGDPYQWLALVGSGFAPAATLELREIGKPAAPPSKPQSVRDNRLEYAARFPAKTSRWQVVVRNPDGARSAPFEFDGGQQVSLSLPRAAPVVAAVPVIETPVPAARFVGSAEDKQSAGLYRTRGADEVYGYLAPLEERYAGDADYDYRLGLAALDSGRYSQAIFVLQRAVATRPGYAGARMELARAYYAQGDNESARREFETLQQDNPPPEAKRAIADYLAAIDRRAAVYQRTMAGYAELGTGFDSNANGATDTQTFLGFRLDDRNVATESSYYVLGGGGQLSYPLAPRWRLQGSGSASYRANPDAPFVDSQGVRLGGGVEWRPNQLSFALGPNLGWAMLDGEDNHQVLGIDGSATWHTEQAQTSLNLRSGQTRYADDLDVLDVDTLLYGVAAQYTTLTMPRCQFVAAVTLGSDDAVESGSQFSRDLTGARISAIFDFGRGHALLTSVSSLSSDYDGTFFIPGVVRKDEQLSASLGYEWGGLRSLGWTLRGQFGWVDNASSISLYEYDRYDFGVSVRKEFR